MAYHRCRRIRAYAQVRRKPAAISKPPGILKELVAIVYSLNPPRIVLVNATLLAPQKCEVLLGAFDDRAYDSVCGRERHNSALLRFLNWPSIRATVVFGCHSRNSRNWPICGKRTVVCLAHRLFTPAERGAEPPRSGRFRAPGSPGAERRENQLLDRRKNIAQIFIHGQDEK